MAVAYWRSCSRFILFSFPGREEEPIGHARLPDIYVFGRGKLSRVARQNPCIVRKVVVEPEVSALRVHGWQGVTSDVAYVESLLHPEHRLEPADPAVVTAKLHHPPIGLRPVALSMGSASPLRPQPEPGVLWLPPHMNAIEVLLRSLQQPPIGGSDLQPLFR